MAVLTATACSSTKPVSMQIDDAAIKTEVLAKLATNGRTNPFRLDVQVSEGVVHLAGTVDDAEEKRLAEQEAERRQRAAGDQRHPRRRRDRRADGGRRDD